MASRSLRITLIEQKAIRKYGPSIAEMAALLEELIQLVSALQPIDRRTYWPKALVAHLHGEQEGVCPLCRHPLSHDLMVDHIIPLAQGGDNRTENIQLVHGRCNLSKSDSCCPDDVLRYLQSRLMNLPLPTRALN